MDETISPVFPASRSDASAASVPEFANVKKLLRRRRAVIAAALLFLGHLHPVGAAEPLTVANAWVRTPAPGQRVAGAYMELRSDAAAVLVRASSPVAARVELHSMSLDGGVMKMRQVENIALAAGKTVKLAPGALHLMLVDLKRPLKEGEQVPLTLAISRVGAITEVRVEATVRGASSVPEHKH
jgi:periplasmic copper chaperone A